MSTNDTTNMSPVDTFDFMDVRHVVYDVDGEKLIAIKPLVDQIGIDWRCQKKALFSEKKSQFFGTRRTSASKRRAPGGIPRKGTVLMRLDRLHSYLTRISIGQVKGQGNETSADLLHKANVKDGKVLHDFETRGIAIKTNSRGLAHHV